MRGSASHHKPVLVQGVQRRRPSRRSPRDVVALCRQPRHLRSTVTVALVVGTVLFTINQLDVVLAGHVSLGTVAKIVLTYCVPFLVANYGIVHATRAKSDEVSDESAPPTDATSFDPSG